MQLPKLSRRDLLVKGSTLSVAGLGLLTGLTTKVSAGEGQTTEQDIDVLNEILGTEHEGIAAYQICLDRKLLQKDTAKTARLFQDHHKKHRDILIERISLLGGAPSVTKKLDEYANDLDTVNLKSQTDALTLIVKLELGAANAYIGMLPSTNDHELVKVAGRIAADEVIHWTTFSSLLHLPLPTQALSFGA
jgi:hypothetical protein